MDHALIVEQLLARCKGFIENIVQAPDLHRVATASLAIFAQLREVARELLQAKMALAAQQRRKQDIAHCCPNANVRDVHTRTVSPETLCGQITIPVPEFAVDRHLRARQPYIGGVSPRKSPQIHRYMD